MAIPSLTTSRLVLRGFIEDDASAMHDILAGKDVLRYFPRTEAPPVERVQKMIAGLLKHWDENGYGLWAVELRSTGELMGRCGVQLIPETDEVEVDFLLGNNYWGKGYATEAGRASLDFGFKVVKPEFIVGIVHPENLASRHVLEKLGMRCVERTHYFGMDVFRYLIHHDELK